MLVYILGNSWQLLHLSSIAMVSYASLCIYWKWQNTLQKVQPFVVIFSCFVLNLVFGSYISFGNQLPYIVSYIREYSSPSDLNLADGTYIFAAQVTGIGFTMILGGIIDKYTGPRVVVLCSGALLCIGISLSYFTIQYSFWLFLLSFGVVYGVGIGLSYMSIITCAVKWMPRWKGLVSGFVLSGIGISPFIFNAVQTGFVNPDNIAPDYSPHPHEKYFTQSQVLDKIPMLFLLLSLLYALTISLSSIFIALPYSSDEEDDTVDEKVDKKKTKIEQMTSLCSDSEDQVKKQDVAISPIEMLKQFKFYHICIMFILGVTINSFVLSLYKSFGFEKVTDDDHFLTIAGSSSAVFNFLGHITWGLLADITDYKFAIVLHSGYVAIIMFTLYATTAVGKIMFFIWLCGLFFGIGGYFSIFPVATAECFGQKHLAINYGIIIGVSEVVGAVIASIISHTLLNYIHWYGNFILLGGLSFIELVLALFLHAYRIKE